MYYLIDENNQICGESLDLFAVAPPLRLVAQAPNSMIEVSAVGFGGSKFKSSHNFGQAFVEQYVPG